MTTVAIFGASGNMGTRACQRLSEGSEYRLLCVESSVAGRELVRKRNLEIVDLASAAEQSDAVLLAVPDRAIGSVASDVVPRMKSGAMLICLDPAAPHAGRIPGRTDISVFVTHPAHPPIFNDETTAEARRDYFGSGIAKQSIVSALLRGCEDDFEKGERIAIRLFGPVLRSHRITVEQMAILEPVLSETLAATCLTVIREGMEIAIARGVPRDAARDFILGHLNIELAIIFNEIDWQFSSGAKMAIEAAKSRLFRDDWRDIFSAEELHASVERISAIDTKAD